MNQFQDSALKANRVISRSIANGFRDGNNNIGQRVAYDPRSMNARLSYTLPPRAVPYNGNRETRPQYNAGSFLKSLTINLADTAVPNGYNTSRSYINYFRPVRDPNIYNSRLYTASLYPNGHPYLYPDHSLFGYRKPYYANGYPYYRNPHSQVPGAVSYNPTTRLPESREYPVTSPECSPYINCAYYPNSNDRRSCVSAMGGPSHCAQQIGGPHRV